MGSGVIRVRVMGEAMRKSHDLRIYMKGGAGLLPC
jgi:hypothetical protein